MISLAFDPTTGECDLVVDADGLLVNDDPIQTAVLVSLFTDVRVTPGEVPEGVSLGGWWGAAYTIEPGDVEGSRLWTLLVRGP
jgi:phage gp46-like protein